MPSPKWKVPDKLKKFCFVFFILTMAGAAFAGPWAEHEAHLPVLQKKIETEENDLRALIEEKKRTDDPKALAEIIKEIVSKYDVLEQNAKDYEEELNHVRFRHPERAETIEHKYAHYHLKTVDTMEREMGLDGRLDRAKAQVLATFPAPPAAAKKIEDAPKIFKIENRQPASDDDMPGALDLKK